MTLEDMDVKDKLFFLQRIKRLPEGACCGSHGEESVFISFFCFNNIFEGEKYRWRDEKVGEGAKTDSWSVLGFPR